VIGPVSIARRQAHFTRAGGEPAPYIARWDGTPWAGVGGGANGRVSVLRPVETPPVGPALYVGGSFATTGGLVTNRLASWVADRCRAGLNGDGVLDFFDSLELHPAAPGPRILAARDPPAGTAVSVPPVKVRTGSCAPARASVGHFVQ
jgi:hypothetical protein